DVAVAIGIASGDRCRDAVAQSLPRVLEGAGSVSIEHAIGHAVLDAGGGLGAFAQEEVERSVAAQVGEDDGSRGAVHAEGSLEGSLPVVLADQNSAVLG